MVLKNQSEEMVNVLVFCLFAGSHYKNSREMANWLSKETREDGSQRFNVTVFVWNDNTDFDNKENIHVFRHPVRKDSMKSEKEASKSTDTLEMVKIITDLVAK